MITTRRGAAQDIRGILSLQEANLVSNMTELEKEQGFVTTPFVPAQINEIIAQDGLFVAEDDGHIVAYIFGGSWTYYGQWEIFNYMSSRFPDLSFGDFLVTRENSFQYGPICIAKTHRGKGLMNKIYEEMRTVMIHRYPLAVTFINSTNQISCRAHNKLGWEIIDEFSYNDNSYLTLAYDMSISAL